MQHIKDLIPANWREHAAPYDVAYFRREIPQLDAWGIEDFVIQQQQALLLEYIRQRKICDGCTVFSNCGKDGDMKGFEQVLERYGNQLTVSVQRCKPFKDDVLRRRVQRYSQLSGLIPEDNEFQFSNFPLEQRRKYPRLMKFAEDFAEKYTTSIPSPGIYLFGPPGVGKTHLMLAVMNRLQERGVPCLFVRSDSIFDRMRHIIAENGDLEPFLEACATAPVLGIDEFAQERANDFTLEKLFRIINYRFHAKLPTWFTSNYAPPEIYRKNGVDLLDSVAPLRSRVMQMTKLAKIDGEDARQRNLQSLT